MITATAAVDIMETDILTLQHDSARAQRHIKEQLDGLNRAERNIAQLVEEVVGLRGEVRRLQSLEKEVRELRALVGTRPEPGVLYELSPGHERSDGDDRRRRGARGADRDAGRGLVSCTTSTRHVSL